ncbi:unnamed protein product [Clavelina lepadiformis]|uniref:Uncharacterized protein n=1 Tax=Clavelina lepadiformis TaxID=159417 RepID=A0ABP0FLI1_CLALP
MNVANIFGLCFLAASFSPGYATECYSCYADVYTNQSAACAGPNIDSSLLRSCPENQTHCFFYSSVFGNLCYRKTHTHFLYIKLLKKQHDVIIDETYWRISRKCTLPAPQPAVGCYSIDGYQSCITTCTTDCCNNQAINNPGLKKLSQRRCYQCRDFFMDFPLHSSRSCIGRNVNSSYLQPCPAGQDNCIFFKI